MRVTGRRRPKCLTHRRFVPRLKEYYAPPTEKPATVNLAPSLAEYVAGSDVKPP